MFIRMSEGTLPAAMKPAVSATRTANTGSGTTPILLSMMRHQARRTGGAFSSSRSMKPQPLHLRADIAHRWRLEARCRIGDMVGHIVGRRPVIARFAHPAEWHRRRGAGCGAVAIDHARPRPGQIALP